jgi:hypothetical protein
MIQSGAGAPRRCERDIIVQMTKIEIAGDPADGERQADAARIARTCSDFIRRLRTSTGSK